MKRQVSRGDPQLVKVWTITTLQNTISDTSMCVTPNTINDVACFWSHPPPPQPPTLPMINMHWSVIQHTTSWALELAQETLNHIDRGKHCGHMYSVIYISPHYKLSIHGAHPTNLAYNENAIHYIIMHLNKVYL